MKKRDYFFFSQHKEEKTAPEIKGICVKNKKTALENKKRSTLFIIIFLIYYLVLTSCDIKDQQGAMFKEEAIRLRVLANSNSQNDQYVKKEVSQAITTYLTSLLTDQETKEESKGTITAHMDELNALAAAVLKEEEVFDQVEVIYSTSVYFPEKKIGQTVYKEGMYEGVLVTIGKGQGDNFWCVLFPSLCFIEKETATDQEQPYCDEREPVVEKRFWLFDKLKQIF